MILLSIINMFAGYAKAPTHETEKKQSDIALVEQHLTAITKTDKPRKHSNIATLNQVADYIKKEFSKYSDKTYFQDYVANGLPYKNVVAVMGREDAPTIVIGAHYDVCGEQEGADDNASGVVGLLELARLFEGVDLKYRIELVAYSLEEPPYFRTQQMGSYIHAKSLADDKVEVYGMVCLEMIGYFDDAEGSQHFPINILSLIYGKKGDFITLVNKFGKGKFAKRFNKQFMKRKQLKTKRFTGPVAVEGIDFSDHANYWHFGFSATMITDTAFMRNPHYHQKTDIMETLDLDKMAKVINTVYEAVIHLR